MDGDYQMLMRYNLCYLSLLLLVNCWTWRPELPPIRVRVYSSFICFLIICLFQIYWICMYFNFNRMFSNYLFQQHLCFNHLLVQGFLKWQVISLVEEVDLVCIFLIFNIFWMTYSLGVPPKQNPKPNIPKLQTLFLSLPPSKSYILFKLVTFKEPYCSDLSH